MNNRIWAVLFFCLASLTGVAKDFTYNGVKPAVIVDVRTPAEYAAGHIEGAINIPVEKIADGIHSVKGLSKDQPVLLYCHSGQRASVAKTVLEKEGYKQVINGGGIDDLSRHLKQ